MRNICPTCDCLKVMINGETFVGTCKVCTNPTPTPYSPSDVVCEACSDSFNLCSRCGARMLEESENYNP
jgi:hypothetical protein